MKIASTASTNSLMKELIAKGEWPQGECFLYAGYQTAGRGQAGNGWESEPNKNLLCSILVESRRTKDQRPFYLNVAVSVAVHKVIKSFIFERSGLLSLSEAVSIKWPNDIYWGDKKVAGILIENAIVGNEVRYSIAGIGLNVNQTEWHSDAPNPISLKQITGQETDVDALMQQLYAEVQKAEQEDVWSYYKAHLYRKDGYWPYIEREVNIAPTTNASSQSQGQFLASIEDVLPSGEIVLKDQTGKRRNYHFKQIRYVV